MRAGIRPVPLRAFERNGPAIWKQSHGPFECSGHIAVVLEFMMINLVSDLPGVSKYDRHAHYQSDNNTNRAEIWPRRWGRLGRPGDPYRYMVDSYSCDFNRCYEALVVNLYFDFLNWMASNSWLLFLVRCTLIVSGDARGQLVRRLCASSARVDLPAHRNNQLPPIGYQMSCVWAIKLLHLSSFSMNSFQ